MNWTSVVDIPQSMRDVQIPALRIDEQSFEPIQRGRDSMRRFGDGGGGFGGGRRAVGGQVAGGEGGRSPSGGGGASGYRDDSGSDVRQYRTMSQELWALQALEWELAANTNRTMSAELWALQALEKEVATNTADASEVLRSLREKIEALTRERSGLRVAIAGMTGNYPSPALEALVALYNHLGAQAKPELGNLVVEGDIVTPSAVMFVAPNVAGGSELRAKAFSLRGIPEKESEKLGKFARMEAIQFVRDHGTPDGLRGLEVSVSTDLGLMMVHGSDRVLELVESLVNAWHANQSPEAKPPSQK